MNWFEDQIKNRMQSDEDAFSTAFMELSSVVMGEAAAKAGLVTPRQKTRNAVQEILKYFGQEIVPVPDSVEDSEDYVSYCIRPSGIMRRRVELTGEWWRDASGPMLGRLAAPDSPSGAGDMVALLPTEKGYSYYDYEGGRRVTVNSATAKKLVKSAYCFYKPLPGRELSVRDLIGYIFGTLTKNDAAYYLTVMAATTVIGLIQPRLSLLLFERVIPRGDSHMLLSIGILMFSMTLATQILSLSQDLIMTRLSMRLANTVEPAAMMRVLSLPADFFKKYAAGELGQKLSLMTAICDSIFSAATGTLLSTLFSLAYLTQIASITPGLLAPSLFMLGGTLIVNIAATLSSIKLHKKILAASAELSGMTYAILSGIQKIKLTGSEKRVFARWAGKYKTAAGYTYNPPFIIKYTEAIGMAISAAGLAAVYFIAIAGKISVGEYMAYNTTYGMVSASAMSLGALVSVFAAIKPQLEMVEPIMKARPEVSGDKAVVHSLSGGIELNNVTFRYSDDGKNVLDGVNMRIRPGQYVAIVGKTGCGKSTLVRLLLGFETPQRGAVYYDGKDAAKLDKPSLRRKIGAVLQNGKLFTGDIYSNIVISAPGLGMDAAWEAARIADVDKDIEAMPMGMHTVITEGSGGVSGGQKQRLMIARAVAPKPKILIFDESTSALDNITQKHVTDSLAKLKCTRVVIAHRLSTIRDCDRIFVLESGRVSGEGTFDELYASHEYFRELVSRQLAEINSDGASQSPRAVV